MKLKEITITDGKYVIPTSIVRTWNRSSMSGSGYYSGYYTYKKVPDSKRAYFCFTLPDKVKVSYTMNMGIYGDTMHSFRFEIGRSKRIHTSGLSYYWNRSLNPLKFKNTPILDPVTQTITNKEPLEAILKSLSKYAN